MQILVAVAFAFLVACLGAQQPADLLFHGGIVFTADDTMSIHSAVAVRDGVILEVGGEEIVGKYRAARVIDLRGRLLIPGFNDTHIHITGRSRRYIDFAGTRSMDELLGKVRAKAEELGPGEWVTGGAWSEDELIEKRRPLRWDLDRAAPDNPVILTRAGGHSSVANSMALALAGVTVDTPDPEGGIIEKDANGELNGVFRERAGMVSRLVPGASQQERRESFLASLRRLLSLGITSIIQAGVSPGGFRQWQEVYAQYGDELPRATVQIRVASGTRGVQRLRSFGRKTGDGDQRLRVGAVKITVDGGYTGPAAWTLEHYRDEPDYYGKQLVGEQELYELVKGAHDLGWQMGFHAIGDAAIAMTVDVFGRVLEESPRVDHRHFLNHFTVLPPAATMRKMARHNILIAQQPNFTYTLEGRYAAHLVGERLQTNNALRTPMSHGIFVALGSDILPIGPMVGIYASVTRRGLSGAVYGVEERLSMPEALVGYTRNGAYLTFEEDVKGTLEPGRLADLIVLSENLLEIDAERILGVRVDLTVVGGAVVYQRGSGQRD